MGGSVGGRRRDEGKGAGAKPGYIVGIQTHIALFLHSPTTFIEDKFKIVYGAGREGAGSGCVGNVSPKGQVQLSESNRILSSVRRISNKCKKLCAKL